MPDWKRYIQENLPSPGLSAERELEIIEELAQHLEAAYEDAISRGETEVEAARRAAAMIGDWRFLECEVAVVERSGAGDRRYELETELSLSQRRKGDWFMRSILQDLRYGQRLLLKSPGFFAAAVLSLALGIGANTAIFSVIDAVLIKTLPVDRPEQLRFIVNVGARGGSGSPPYPCFERFRAETQSFVGMAAFSGNVPRLMTIEGQREEVAGQRVSGNYFSLLGVGPALGRVLTPEDDAIAGQGGREGLAAVISYNYWTRRFGQKPDVIGKTITVNDKVATIVGVIRPDFYGLNPGAEIAVYLPIMSIDSGSLTSKALWWFQTVARLKPGATEEKARAELDPIFESHMDETPFSAERRRDYFARIELQPASRGLDSLRRQYSKPLQALMVIVGLTLLIACANVANLLLSRATARRKEYALRLALGASRSRMIQQMLVESAILVGIGAALGLALARLGCSFLTSFFATGRNRILVDAPLNLRVLLFTIGVAVLTGLLFGLAPAIRAARVDPNPALKDGVARLRLGSALVVTQIILSILLLVGAGMFLRTLRNLRSFDAGFDSSGVLNMRVSPSDRLYQGPRRMNLWNEILERVRHVPGVNSASLSTLTPFDGDGRAILILVAGFTPSAESDNAVALSQVSTGFLSTLKIPLLEGRDFRPEDNETGPNVALLNESAAKFYFAGRRAVGGMFRPRSRDVMYQVVGVVKDTRYSNLREPDGRRVYLPIPQAIDGSSSFQLSVRAADIGSETLSAVRGEINAAGSEITIHNISTLDQQVDQSLLQERLVSMLSLAFAVLGLVLAAVGLFGVMSYEVARRTHEIGVRMALGARATDVVRLVMRDTLQVVIFGVSIGVIVSLGAAKLISSLLFGLSVRDPLTFTSAAVLMIVTAAIASYQPARRAASVDPMVCLREE